MDGRWAKGAFVALAALLAAPKLVHVWSSSPIFSLGFLVAPWAFWWVLRRPQGTPASAGARSLALLATVSLVASAWYFAATFLALWSVAAALLLVALEKGQTRASALPLAALLLTVPPPGFATLLADAQSLVASTSGVILAWVGIAVTLDAFTLVTPRYSFTVTPACSGFSGLLATGAFVAMAGSHLASGIRRVLVAAGLGLALVAVLNILRVVVLVWITEQGGPLLIESAFHEGISIVLALVAVVAVVPILHIVPPAGEPRILVEASP